MSHILTTHFEQLKMFTFFLLFEDKYAHENSTTTIKFTNSNGKWVQSIELS